jgi:hypothetical protein
LFVKSFHQPVPTLAKRLLGAETLFLGVGLTFEVPYPAVEKMFTYVDYRNLVMTISAMSMRQNRLM